MARRPLVAAVIGVALIMTPARAQLCAGLPSFANGPTQMSLSLDPADIKTVRGGLALGGQRGFGQLGIGKINIPEFGGTGFELGAAAGSQVPLDRGGIVHFCPIASVSMVFGPDKVVNSVLLSNYAFGVSVGAVVLHPPRVKLIPTASLSFVFANTRVRYYPDAEAVSTTEYVGMLALGGGILLDRLLSVRALMSIPIGLEGASNSYEAGISINFGRRAT